MRIRTSVPAAISNHHWPIKAHGLFLILALSFGVAAQAQTFPNVRCHVENYSLNAEIDWQVRQPLVSDEVVVLRDPAHEQEARFDMRHGASLYSLRYQGKELLFGHSAGADVSMYAIRHGTESELKGLSPYWSAFHPDQGGSSMGVPATTVGVACRGENSMEAFAMMVDAGVNSAFVSEPLMGVWMGRISENFPPAYSTPYVLETEASWVKNPRGQPRYYLKLGQTVINVRPSSSGSMQWFLTGAAPWNFSHGITNVSRCTEKTPCTGDAVRAVATGQYEDAAHSLGVAAVVPTGAWHTQKLYLQGAVSPYGGVPVVRKQSFGIVLTHTLNGITAFHFAWYLCAGNWDQAKDFASSLAH